MSTTICRFLDTNGDGTGTKDAIGDYSSAAEDFYIQPGANETYEIHRLIVRIADSGAPDAGKYGNNITLTNGISVHLEGGITRDLTDNMPVLSNGDRSKLCYDVNVISWGTGDDYVGVRWTFSKSGAPITLRGSISDKLIVRLNDDFSNLVGHTFMVQGQNLGG